MDPKSLQRAQEAMQAMHAAVHALNNEYVALLMRCGCQHVTIHRW